MPRPRTALLVLTAVLAAVLSGCARTEDVGANRTVQVGVTEYMLRPNDVHASTGPITIVVHNYGLLTHSFVITQEGQKEASTGTIWPGQTAELPVDLPKGTYTMASNVVSDQPLGVYGTLTIS